MSRGGHSSGGRGSHSSSRSSSHSSRSSGSYRSSSNHSNSSNNPKIFFAPVFYAAARRGSTLATKAAVVLVFAIVSVFLLTGIAFLVVGITTSGQSYATVKGIAIANDFAYSMADDDFYYYTTYRYSYDGRVYTEKSDIGWDEPETLGKSVTLYVSLDDPRIITEDKPSDTSVLTIIGAFVVIASVVVLIIAVNTCKKARADANKPVEAVASVEEHSFFTTPQSVAQSVPTSDSPFEELAEHDDKFVPSTLAAKEIVTCEYCGRQLSADTDECPYCGAIIKIKKT